MINQIWSAPVTGSATAIPAYTVCLCNYYIAAQVQELPYDVLLAYADDWLLMAQPGDVPTDAHL